MSTQPPAPGHAVIDEARARRNANWAMLRARGVPWRKIARNDGVSLSTVQRGVAAHLEAVEQTAQAARELTEPDAAAAVGDAERPSDLSPERIYLLVIRSMVEAMDDLHVLSLTAEQPSWRIGAAKGRLQAARELAHALALVGLLPDPGRVLLSRAQRAHSAQDLRELLRAA